MLQKVLVLRDAARRVGKKGSNSEITMKETKTGLKNQGKIFKENKDSQ